MSKTVAVPESMTLDQREVITRAVLYGVREMAAAHPRPEILKPFAEALAEAMVSAVTVINKVPLDTGVPSSCCAPMEPGVIHEVKG